MTYLFIVLLGMAGQLGPGMNYKYAGDTLRHPLTSIPLKSTIARIAPNTIVLILKVDTVISASETGAARDGHQEQEIRIFGTIEENLGRGMATISYPARGQQVSVYYEGTQVKPAVNQRIKVRVTEVYNSSDTRKAIYMTYFYRNLDTVN